MSRIKLNKSQLEASFNEIYNSYSSSIYKFCLAKLNCNEEYAQDCTQETFIVFYEKLKSGDQFKNERAFLYRTALNFVRRKYAEIQKKSESEANIDDFVELLGKTDNTDYKLDYEIIIQQIEILLNDEEKKIYNLRFVEEVKIKDIAVAIGITEENCAVKISRLKRKLQEKLKEYI